MHKLAIILLLLVSFSANAQQPEIKGGLETFVKNNIVYPPYSLHNCIQGTVNVGFKLNAKGEVYYTAITEGFGIDLDDEALRLVRMTSNKWSIPSNYDTNTLLIVPVNFTLSGYECNRKSKSDIALAIKSYLDQEALTDAITNFYKSKEKGEYKPEDEATIEQIKAQLNIDDEYLDEIISTGLKKIKQGDKVGACEDFNFVKYMGSDKANEFLLKYCK